MNRLIITTKIGLTLLELIIASSFLSLVIMSAVSVNLSANRFLSTESSQADLANEVAAAVERISRDIKLSFGSPADFGSRAFSILNPGLNSGNDICLRTDDNGALGPDNSDTWTVYRLTGSTIEFSDNCGDVAAGGTCPGSWEVIAKNVVTINDIFQAVDADNDGNPLNDNLIRLEITCRQDPSQAASVDNPEVALVSTMRIQSAASR